MGLAPELPAPGDGELARPDLLTLLIIDDERAIREACRQIAESLGFRALTAESAPMAMRLLGTHTVDIVLLDLKLPGGQGLSWLQQVRQVKPGATIVVI